MPEGADMSRMLRAVNGVVRLMTRIVCRVDDSIFEAIPEKGPLIVIANHVNWIETPIIRSRLRSRPVAGLAKSDTWKNPLWAWLFNLWGAIPLRRGEADTKALRLGLQALEQGKILAIAPEGTRSGHGRMQRGHPGVVLVALRSGAPLLPLGFYGAENLLFNMKRLRRTDFNISMGHPFSLNSRGERVTGEVRQRMTDEIMYQLASVLPSAYRGVYGSLTEATERYLDFPPSSSSNLQFAKQQKESATV